MARPRAAPDVQLLSKVSTLYYLRDHTQQEVADRLRLSRQKVARLLQEALELGIVQVSYRVTVAARFHTELESAIEARYGLREVHVVDSNPGDDVNRELGSAAAAYLARTIQPGETIGLAWGRALSAMVESTYPLATRKVRVVQTLGGVGAPDSDAYAGRLVRRLAELLGGTAVMLPAPGIVPSAEVRDGLRRDPHIHAALGELDSLDTIFVGIGSLGSNPILNDGTSLPASVRDELEAGGAVGDVALRFFDAEGALVRTALDDQLLGITAAQLQAAGRVVGVAGGADRVDAISGALKGGLVDVLITDRVTAEALV